MRALSVLQPWAWAIAKGHKSVENRDWPPPKGTIGSRIAIHASKKPVGQEDREEFDEQMFEFQIFAPDWPTMPYGAVVAVATLRGFVDAAGAKTLPRNAYRWFVGTYGWLFDDVVELPEPVPAKGSLGLWVMTSDVETAVLHQLGKALAPDDTRLGRELGKLAAHNPEVAAAQRRLDQVVRDIVAGTKGRKP
jgi:hypothetical protein